MPVCCYFCPVCNAGQCFVFDKNDPADTMKIKKRKNEVNDTVFVSNLIQNCMLTVQFLSIQIDSNIYIHMQFISILPNCIITVYIEIHMYYVASFFLLRCYFSFCKCKNLFYGHSMYKYYWQQFAKHAQRHHFRIKSNLFVAYGSW